jgi:glycosyltransferase domain-containing protein
MPYRFLLPDGQVRPALARLLTDSKKIYPHLDIEYVQYPDDVDFRCYFAKMHDALQRVRTPYVMYADNDDFLIAGGIERSIDFLDNAPEYVCCGGGIAGFSVFAPTGSPNPGLVGAFNKFSFRYAAEDRSLDLGQSSVTERMMAGGQYSWAYYGVYRAPVLESIWRELVELNLSDLMLHEWFGGLRTLSFGRARSDPTVIGYMRQYWTTMRTSFSKDWVHHLVRSRFSTDFTAIVELLSKAAADSDGVNPDEVAEKLRQSFQAWYGGFLRHNYGPVGKLRHFLRENTPGLLMWLKQRRRYSVPFERRNLFKKLAGHGASGEYLEQFRKELAGIEDTLTGKAFAAFLQPFLAVPGLGKD